ncbi:MAG: Holliday junction resolvase-like protein [Dehalococcoidia bacterium]
MDVSWVVAIALFGLLIVVAVSRLWAGRMAAEWRARELTAVEARLRGEAELSLAAWKAEAERGIRDDAVARSRSVTIGKVTEHLTPYLEGFPYNPKDVRFIGSPVDLVVFDGLDEGALRNVLLVEVKTGGSQLSARERQVRAAVLEGRVAWDEVRFPGSRE